MKQEQFSHRKTPQLHPDRASTNPQANKDAMLQKKRLQLKKNMTIVRNETDKHATQYPNQLFFPGPQFGRARHLTAILGNVLRSWMLTLSSRMPSSVPTYLGRCMSTIFAGNVLKGGLTVACHLHSIRDPSSRDRHRHPGFDIWPASNDPPHSCLNLRRPRRKAVVSSGFS